MPMPTLTDVDELAQKLMAPVRAGFWFGSVVENRCTRFELTPGHGNVGYLMTVNDFYVDNVPDAAKMEQMQAIVSSESSITAGLVGGQFVINKAAEYSATENLMALASTRITNELRKKRAQDLLGVAPLFTATPICGAGSTLAFGHMQAGEAQLEAQSTRKAGDTSRKTLVQHRFALHPVIRNMQGLQSAGTMNSIPVPAGYSQNLLERRLPGQQSPIFTLPGGTEVYQENYITISTNSTGMIFFEDGVIYMPAVDLEEVVHDKVPGLYGAIVDVWARYGVGIGPYQADGISVVALAATPTS